MTRKGLVGAADHIRSTRARKFLEQRGKCAVCGKLLTTEMQLAHKIPQRKWCLREWGAEVIHHPRNMALVCSLECNARVQMNPESLGAAQLAASILQELA